MKENRILRFQQFLNEEENSEKPAEIIQPEENKGEYSTEDMDAFVKALVDLVDWNEKVEISLPSDRQASHISNTKEEAIEDWTKAKKQFENDKNIKWFIWHASVGGSFNKPRKFDTQRYDKDSILDIAKRYPDAVRTVNISFNSDEQRKFADFMKDWTKGS